MTVKEALQLPRHQLKPVHLKKMEAEYKEMGRDVCTSCPGSINEMILTLKRKYEMSQFTIKGNKYYRLSKDSSKTINNNIITDDLAIEFLKIDPNRIKLFEVYPDNWKELVGVEEEKEDKDLMDYKLSELREMYPDVKQEFGQSKADFVEKIKASL